MSRLDEYSPSLMNLFHSKGGAIGLRLRTVLLKDADEDHVAQNLSGQAMKIYSIKTDPSEDKEDIGIAIDGTKVLANLGNLLRACAMLMGVTYALTLVYPKELRDTFEAFQKLFLELDGAKSFPKVHNLKSKLLAT